MQLSGYEGMGEKIIGVEKDIHTIVEFIGECSTDVASVCDLRRR